MSTGPWSLRERTLLYELWGKSTPHVIAKTIGRSREAILEQAYRQGLTTDRRIGWSDEDEKELTHLRRVEGLSIPKISNKMNRSYDSVASRLRKLQSRDKDALGRRTAGDQSMRVSASSFLHEPEAIHDPKHPTAKPWVERTFGQCAYPVSRVGSTMFSCCTEVEVGKNYCPKHCKIMFVPLDKFQEPPKGATWDVMVLE